MSEYIDNAHRVEVKSVEPFKGLSPEERKERYRQLRAKLGTSRMAVKGKPGVHYFWACKTDDNEMIRLDTLGYSIVRESDPLAVKSGKKKGEVEAQGLKDDGTYTIGDVILMQCAQEDYEFFLLDTEERHSNMINAVAQEFRDSAEKQGVPTFSVEREK